MHIPWPFTVIGFGGASLVDAADRRRWHLKRPVRALPAATKIWYSLLVEHVAA